MSRSDRKQSGGGDSNGWMVTFSDCMTLLLCFFVMLLSFSSFDPQDLSRVLEGFEMATHASGFGTQRPSREGLLEDPTYIDRTEVGSERPTFDRLAPTRTPRAPEDPLSRDAYCDRRVLSIPSGLLFWGRGAALKPEAKPVLGRVADFLRLMPCRVVIRETPGPHPPTEASLRRALAVMTHFTEAEGLPAERFAISAAAPAPGETPHEPVIRIAMLNREVYP